MLIDELSFPVENIIFPVGQGGLFLGLIKYQELNKLETKTFAYIYDCGNIKRTYLETSINNLIEAFQKSNIEEWTYIFGSKKEIIKRNLIAGIFRGVGIGIGVTIITAILIILLQRIVALNIPIIGEYIADIVEIVQRSR